MEKTERNMRVWGTHNGLGDNREGAEADGLGVVDGDLIAEVGLDVDGGEAVGQGRRVDVDLRTEEGHGPGKNRWSRCPANKSLLKISWPRGATAGGR